MIYSLKVAEEETLHIIIDALHYLSKLHFKYSLEISSNA